MTNSPALQFPDGFAWGVATASYQIEGAVNEDGRGPSIWDTFAHTPGRVANGDTGDVACDHYHRYREDVALIRGLNASVYRFSLAWPRFQPDGHGPLNPDGVAFYDRLIDELLNAGVRPWITLYHWDLPQALEDAGGWPERATAYRFAEYAAAVHARFADRVADWTTLNEPWCSAFVGYAAGNHAPGRQEPAAAVRAAHHLMLGHGLAVEAMRSARADLRYGITLNLYPTDPATDDPADVDAARRVDGVGNRIFLDPILRGRYPDDVLADLDPISGRGHIQPGDEKQIGLPLDVLGVNYYSRHVVRARPDGSSSEVNLAWVGAGHVESVRTGLPRTAADWEIDPPGLYDILTRISREYDTPPLYITENGAAFDDLITADGAVHDQQRIDFLDQHFRQARRAIADGVDLRGYFVWSLLDNFEWAWGYDRRFGIVYVDYEAQRRLMKDSAHWYASVAATNTVPAG
jgi:beta-glucosidase